MIRTIRILRKDILELLRSKSALGVIRIAITPMLRAIDIDQVDAEQRVRQPGVGRWVREVDVDDEQRECAQDHTETQVVEPDEGVARPQDAVPVPIEVLAVLLQHGLVPVALCPVAFGGAVGLVVGCGDVGAGEAWRC